MFILSEDDTNEQHINVYPAPGLGRAHKFGGVKPANRIPTMYIKRHNPLLNYGLQLIADY
jgi:hypothetical protein